MLKSTLYFIIFYNYTFNIIKYTFINTLCCNIKGNNKMNNNKNTKTISISIPEKWVLKLKRKALKRIEKTSRHVTVSELIAEALSEHFGFKIEE